MIRLLSLVVLVATVSLAREIPVCPSKDILKPLGCSCRVDVKNRMAARCNATEWNSKTSGEFADALKESNIHALQEFRLRGKLNWEGEIGEGKQSTPFSALCGLDILFFALKDFTYDGAPPECSFPNWIFDNVTIDVPTFTKAIGNVEAVQFIHQDRITGLENLQSVKTLFLFDCKQFDTTQMKNWKNLQFLDIYRTQLQSSVLSSDILPTHSASILRLKIKACNISIVSSDLLTALPRLRELDLAHNRIRDFPEDTLREHRVALTLYGNPLDCPKLDWLKYRIENGSIELVDEEVTRCDVPRGARFIEAKKIDFNVDVEKPVNFLGSLPEISACLALCVGLCFFLTVCHLQRRRTARGITWFEEPYPREDQPWLAQDKQAISPSRA